MPDLLSIKSIDELPGEFVKHHCKIDREFSHHTQGSGNVSWLVEDSGTRLFVKTAGTDTPPQTSEPRPYFDHAGRVRLLRNAVELSRSCPHPALADLLNVVESPAGPMLIYEAVPGELVGVTSKPVSGGSARLRQDPTSAYQRFANLPGADLLTIFDTLIDLHGLLGAAGWVACDLYDGCLIVNFSTLTLHVVDLDNYRRGPSPNDMGRMFGSSLFMAPEEFERGATIDQRTTVFNLGRLIWHFATRLTERRNRFCGTHRLASTIERAIEPAPEDRYQSLEDLAAAWYSKRNHIRGVPDQ